jgi:hypothetical protein
MSMNVAKFVVPVCNFKIIQVYVKLPYMEMFLIAESLNFQVSD